MVDAIFEPLSTTFTGEIAPAVGLATVAVVTLSVVVRKLSGAFKRG